jgi:hypothetical protein
LLHHLQRGTEDGTTQVGLLSPETTLEAVGPAGEPSGGWDHLSLVLVVGNDLGNLDLDVFGVLGLATKARQRFHGLLDPASLDEVAGRIWEEDQTTAENKTPGELDADRNAVGASVGAVLGGIVDAGCEQETNGNAELVTGNEGTTDFTRALEATC